MIGCQVLGTVGCIVGATAPSINALIGANLCNGIAAAGQLSFGIIIGEIVPNRMRGPAIAVIFLTSLPFAGKSLCKILRLRKILILLSIRTKYCTSLHSPHNIQVAMELLYWHHLQHSFPRPVPILLSPTDLQSAPRTRKIKVATIQGARLWWPCSLLGWHRSLPHWSQLGWYCLPLGFSSGYRHDCCRTSMPSRLWLV